MQDSNFLTVNADDGLKTAIAFCQDGAVDDVNGRAGLFWLGGFMSDMQGSKAQLLARLAEKENRPCLRFDYSGHGSSGGKFRDGTISKWLKEAIAVFATQSKGPRIIVSSSMGGWLALLLYRYFQKNDPKIVDRIKAIVLIAPAVDMTEKLMWEKYDAKIRREIMENGAYLEPSEYGDEPYIITRDLIEDGKKHLLMDKSIELNCPVRILQGEEDRDVSWQHGLAIYNLISGRDVSFTLIKAGDHRLSNPQNLETIRQTCLSLFALADC